MEFSKKLAAVLQQKDKHQFKLLEIGCGAGDVTADLIAQGYDAYGADIEFKEGPMLKELIKQGKIFKIGKEDLNRRNLNAHREFYCLPFDDEQFDMTFSESTVEHVENLEDFVAEAARVTKLGGVSIHYFPSKFSIIEPHIGIPLGGIIKNKFYYFIMIKFGLSFKRYRTISGPQECLDFMNSATFYQRRSFYIHLFEKNNFELLHDGPEGIIQAKAEAGNRLARIIRKSKFLILLFKYLRSNVYIFRKIKDSKE